MGHVSPNYFFQRINNIVQNSPPRGLDKILAESRKQPLSSGDELELMTARQLIRQEEGFGILALATQFERAKILVPRSFGNVWLRFHPKAQLIQVGESDMAVMHTLDQMVSNGGGQRGPCLDLRHHSPSVTRLVLLTWVYSPKTKRPNWSPNCLTCSRSSAARKRSAN